MKVNVTLKRKLVFNGKEYDSVEELPENVRVAYEKAVADGALPGAAAGGAGASAKITVCGKTYDSPGSMPPEVRRLYEDAMEVVKARGLPPLPGTTAAGSPEATTGADSPDVARLASSPTPIGPDSATPVSRVSIALLAGLALLALLAYLILR